MSVSLQPLGDALRSLPKPVRVWLYAVFSLVGAGLGVAAQVGLTDLGPVTVDQVLPWYILLVPVMGSIAVSNTKGPEPWGGSTGYDPRDFHEDADLASFAPVGGEAEVYG